MKNRPYFIAEIGVNHEANIKLAKKIILDAKMSGADAVKLQAYKAEKLASKYAKAYWDKKEESETSQLKLYKKFDKLTNSDYDEIISYCKKIKIDFIITPFDLDCVDFFKNKVKSFKISSSDITNFPLIEKVAKTGKPLILSTGASNMKEIKNVLKFLKNKNNNISLLHCILNYPTKRYDANLEMIEDLKKLKLPVGISDHTKPVDSHDILIYSVIKGVRIIEKHFTNNKKKKGNDHFHSFDKNDLKNFKIKLDDLYKILGKDKKNYLSSEKSSRTNARRSLFYKDYIKKNQRLNKDHFISLRPACGITPDKIRLLLGKTMKLNRKKGDLVKFSDFK